MKSKRQLQKESTRNKIIGTAYQVISKQGFAAPTSAVAKEAGLSHGTIFLHFPTSVDLLIGVIRDFGGKLGAELHELSDSSGSMEEMLKAHLGVIGRYEDFYTRLVSEKSLLPAEAQMIFADILSIVSYHFSNVIEREIKKEGVKDIPACLMFHTWMGLIHYYLLDKDNFSPDMPVLEKHGPKLTAVYLELMKK